MALFEDNHKMTIEENIQKDDSSKYLPLIAILIVTRNRCDMLSQVLSQLQEIDYPKDKLSIFIVDGASTDGTVDMVSGKFPSAHILTTGVMKQIAAAENTGIKEILKYGSKYKYIWMLDDDAEIEPQTLMPLVKESENDPNIGLIGSAIYDPLDRDRLIAAGFRVVWKRLGIACNKPNHDEVNNLFDVEIVPACSSLSRTELYREDIVGLWDQLFWMYWPDNDWCLRTLRNGYRVCCVGKSRAWHRDWATAKRYFFTPIAIHSSIRGSLLFFLRHHPTNAMAYMQKYLLKCYLKAAFENFTMRPNIADAYNDAVQDFIKGHLTEKDTSMWDDMALSSLDDICLNLSRRTGTKVRIILNKFSNDQHKTEIKKVFEKHFEHIDWTNIDLTNKGSKANPTKPLKEYLFVHFPRLLFRLLDFSSRYDVVISPVELLEYNIGSAKYTVLLDPSLKGCVRKNHLLKAFGRFLKMIITGIRVVYFKLPHAYKNSQAMQKVIHAYPNLPQPSPKGIDDRKTIVM